MEIIHSVIYGFIHHQMLDMTRETVTVSFDIHVHRNFMRLPTFAFSSATKQRMKMQFHSIQEAYPPGTVSLILKLKSNPKREVRRSME